MIPDQGAARWVARDETSEGARWGSPLISRSGPQKRAPVVPVGLRPWWWGRPPLAPAEDCPRGATPLPCGSPARHGSSGRAYPTGVGVPVLPVVRQQSPLGCQSAHHATLDIRNSVPYGALPRVCGGIPRPAAPVPRRLRRQAYMRVEQHMLAVCSNATVVSHSRAPPACQMLERVGNGCPWPGRRAVAAVGLWVMQPSAGGCMRRYPGAGSAVVAAMASARCEVTPPGAR